MHVTVRLFARQRELAGWRTRVLQLPEGATVEGAWQALLAEVPALEPGAGSVRFARNTAYVDASALLSDGDELAVIPPVAGGAGSETPESQPFRRLELQESPFDDALLAELRATVPSSRDGALVIFMGQTRETAGTPAPGEEPAAARFAGRRVEELDYGAYASMALPIFGHIADEIAVRFGVTRLAILHRTGRVPLGDASVVIAAAAPHRAAAFDACRYAIEELKARAPIWKAEHFGDGSVWVGAPARHGPIDEDETNPEARGGAGT